MWRDSIIILLVAGAFFGSWFIGSEIMLIRSGALVPGVVMGLLVGSVMGVRKWGWVKYLLGLVLGMLAGTVSLLMLVWSNLGTWDWQPVYYRLLYGSVVGMFMLAGVFSIATILGLVIVKVGRRWREKRSLNKREK